MNDVNIAGCVAKAPETRGSVTTLIVATDRAKPKERKSYIGEGTGYAAKETEFRKAAYFNGLGKSAASFKQRDVVAINGRVHYSSWEDRDGITRRGCESIANSIDFF